MFRPWLAGFETFVKEEALRQIKSVSFQLDAKGGTPVKFGIEHVNFAFVVYFDDTLAEAQTQTPAAALCGIARFKNSGEF